LISRTSDAGAARFTLEAPGELNPDRQYYWHVRAKDVKGVWGPWSKTWAFTPRGPAPPLNVTLQFNADRNRGTLHWTPNPLGRKPVAYAVYASDEKGFSVADDPFSVAAGIYDFDQKTSTRPPTQFPANFLARTASNELAVIGAGIPLTAANKAFYRVVAIDENGKRSGPSDYVAAPRPVIYSQPVVRAQTGADYRYEVRAIRSLGDMRTRDVNGKEVMNYWDVERPRFHIEQGPPWLRIDESTGQLSGKPDRPGRSEVTIAVALEQELRTLDPAQLQWGIEKTTDTCRASLGSSKQTFVVDTTP